MKYDNLQIVECEGVENKPVLKVVKKKRKISVFDVVIMQLILCVVVSTVILAARVITVSSMKKQPVDEGKTIDRVVVLDDNAFGF